MGSVIDHDLVEDIVARGRVTADDVDDLRRTVYRDGVVDRAEADAIFFINSACAEKDPSWSAFFVDALTDFVIWQDKPKKHVSDAESQYLIAHILHDGHVDTATELELLINVVHWAVSSPPSLAFLALKAIRDSVLEPATALRGSNRPPAIVSPADVELIRKVIYAAGSPGGYTVTRDEAELIVALNDATDSSENADTWRDLFVKAIANYLMFPAAAPAVPTAEEELAREHWLEEKRDVGKLIAGIGSSFLRLDIPFREAWRETDMFGTVSRREERQREARRLADAMGRESIDAAEAAWLVKNIGKNGSLDDSERALLAFIKKYAPVIDPAAAPLFARAGL
ncbi:MAG: hypothetical protein HKM95_02855 [Inquilinus sp.]|nr:hypothetical protein [Inquilinus sp.]